MKPDKEFEGIFEDAGFEMLLEKANAGYFMEISQYTPENEEWTERLFVGDARRCDIAYAVSERLENFSVAEELAVRKDEIGKQGYPQTEKEQIDDIKWFKKQLRILDNKLEPFANDTKSVFIKENDLER